MNTGLLQYLNKIQDMKNSFKLKEHGHNENNQFGLRIQTPHEYYSSEPHNLVSIYFFKKYWWFKIPQVFAPVSQWVDLTDKDWATFNKDGTKGYTKYIQRSYGVSTFENGVHIHYGIQPGRWSSNDKINSDHVKVLNIPWLTWERECIEFLNLDKTIFSVYRDNKNGSINFDALNEHQENVPKIKFAFKDFDGEEIVATCYLQNARYSCGTGFFKFLRFFKKKDYPRMDISFNKETGYEKGSWKGGTMGTSCELKETALKSFQHYANEEDHYKNHGRKIRGFTDIRIID